MVPDTHTPAPTPVTSGEAEHCPHCRGRIRPGAPWCTQCWADLRPAPAAPAAEHVPSPAHAAPEHAAVHEAPDEAAPRCAVPTADAGWPCATCDALNGFDLDTCAVCGAGFLAAMKAEEAPLLLLPGVGDVTRLSRVQRLGLALAVAAAFATLVLLIGLLLG